MSLSTHASRIVFLDTETTGLYPAMGDRIVEIGLVEYIDRRPTGNVFQAYINPERDVPSEVVAIHGLDNNFLRDKPVFSVIVEEFLEFCKGAEIVIHNAPFDLAFLNMELARSGHSEFDMKTAGIIDTLVISKREGVSKRHSLDTLCDRFHINRKHRKFHGALMDAELLAEVYVNLTRGQENLGMMFHSDVSVTMPEVNTVSHLSTSLTVCCASAAEEEEHEAYLAIMMKENGGKKIWQQDESRKTLARP